MQNNEVRVRVQVVNKRDEVVNQEKAFKTEEAANKWLDQQDEKGTLVQVLAWGTK